MAESSNKFQVKLLVKIKFLYLISNLLIAFSVLGFVLFFIIDFPTRNSGEMYHSYYEMLPAWISNFISIAIICFLLGIALRRKSRMKANLTILEETIQIHSKKINSIIDLSKVKHIYLVESGYIFKTKKIQINTTTASPISIIPKSEIDYEAIINQFFTLIPNKVHQEVLQFGNMD